VHRARKAEDEAKADARYQNDYDENDYAHSVMPSNAREASHRRTATLTAQRNRARQRRSG
jgi:hypothetical protein